MAIDRDERRRRIMERGSDRLALITGQLHTLESSSPSSSSSAATHQRAFSESFTTQTRFDDRLTQQSASLKNRTKDTEESTTKEPPKRQKPEEESTKSVIKNQNQQIRSVFTSKKLNSSIINSEQTRILSSLTMAVMVVFLPRLNILKSESILALRPLCLLLLTNCAIVMSHVTAMEGGGEEEEGEKGKSGKNGENWSDAEKVLERGVVVYQALRALFIDFSLYIVVVICGLSIF